MQTTAELLGSLFTLTYLFILTDQELQFYEVSKRILYCWRIIGERIANSSDSRDAP